MGWTPFTRLDHDRSEQRYTSDITDREFALIAPHLSAPPGRGRKRRTDLRAAWMGSFICYRMVVPGANLPKDFPPKSTVYWYFRRFREDGTWARIPDALYVDCRDLEGREAQPSAAIIDSQSVKIGPNAFDSVGYVPAKRSKDPSATSSPTPWAFSSRPTSIPLASRITMAHHGCSST